MEKIFQIISYIKWLFLIWMIVLIVFVFIRIPNVEISQIGTAVFLCGIFLGLDSLGDSNALSKKEEKFFANEKNVKIQTAILLGTSILILIISLFFLSLQFIFPSMNSYLLENFSALAYDCMALMLGLLCSLKQVQDKQKTYANLNIQ